MDEAVGDEVMDAAAGTHIPSKESEFLLKSGGSDHVQAHGIILGDHNKSLSHLLTDVLDGKNLDRIGSSEHASVSPRCMDDTGVMVEELTLRNYDGETVLGTSNNRDRTQSRQNQWQHLYQLASGSGSGNFHGEVTNRDKNQETSSVWEDVGHSFFSGGLDQKRRISTENYNEVSDNPPYGDYQVTSNNTLSSGFTRTKILSNSGFPEYFIKNTLKGKGVVYRGPVHRGSVGASGDQAQPKSDNTGMAGSDAPLTSAVDIVKPHGIAETCPTISTNSSADGVILRDWLEAGKNKVNKAENLYIFRQIVELVEFSHSRGVALEDLRPSCFRLLQSNKVLYLGSSIPTTLSDKVLDLDVSQSVHNKNKKGPLEQDLHPPLNPWAKRQKCGDSRTYHKRWPQSSSSSSFKPSFFNVSKADGGFGPDSRNEPSKKHDQETGCMLQSRSSMPHAFNVTPQLSTPLGCSLERRWYASPEQVTERCSTFPSNIYSLGVLLFEVRE